MAVMVDIFSWLDHNSAALQSSSSVLSVLVGFATIYVLCITWKAIKRQAAAAEEQATAARAQTKVAKEQTRVALDAAKAAGRQSDLLSAQIEQSVAPLVVCEQDQRPGYFGYQFVNRGQGPAFQVYYWDGDLEAGKKGDGVPIHPLEPSTLGVGHSVYVPIPREWRAFTAVYKGTDRARRWTVVYRDVDKPQEHIVQRGSQQIYLS